jgi:AcrR family transcriptional regulator
MVKDAQVTRQRLLDAAAAEFAEHGISGARVDRIANDAGYNKALLYHHFESKDLLFDAVFDAMCVETVREIPIDATDLPEYAGKLFDGFEAHPDRTRLATWYRLERADPLPVVLASMKDKAAKIEQAQRDGVVSSRYDAVDLLALVLHISGVWYSATPELVHMTKRHSKARRRKVVTDAVTDLLAG